MLTCNRGNLEVFKAGKNNVANVLLNNNIKTIYAYDGNVSFGNPMTTWYTGDYQSRLARDQSGFNSIVKKYGGQPRNPQGKIKYEKPKPYEPSHRA